MTIFSVFTLLGGLAFFIYGMNQMSHSLESIAGEKMYTVINKMTGNRLLGLLLGCVITVAIQSSSAVTVMLIGLVNSGLMSISNTVGIIMGSNIGTTFTAWIMSLIGVSSESFFVKMLNPQSFSPLLAFIGIGLLMLSKTAKKKEVGNSFIGFAILMYGMVMMSGSVSPLADSPQFASLLTAFRSPLLGVLTGMIVTAVIQSSAASVGMLQALTLTGGITYGMAIPIIMGQNIGTCATAILSSIGVGRNAKRVAAIHLSFNLIGTAVFMLLFYVLHGIVDFAFVDRTINPFGVALCHGLFNVGTTALLLPFSNLLVKIATTAIKTEPEGKVAFLDERLFQTPAVAIAECDRLSSEMAIMAQVSVEKAIQHYGSQTEEQAANVRRLEGLVDTYEDHLGTYLVRLSGSSLSEKDTKRAARMLHAIGNFERISDLALNLVESAEEIAEKKLDISEKASIELDKLARAITEITELTVQAYVTGNSEYARSVEPLEQVVDRLVEASRLGHIERLQANECTLERGFVLADTLNSYERIADHCSNIAVAVLEADDNVFQPHEYLSKVKSFDNPEFRAKYQEYSEKYL